ncbi:hypothetical protein [Neorhizobium sp. SOG26]|uniref:hypothetical protein n=1 Tax=Neorhizobium sp. SOG26 TaxID=2060726 RepID=UPI0019004D2D|nr:hypothetical protein [Neorhizobium sp. SOG26]
MAGGRPSKYDPAYCEQVVEHMKDGASLTSFAAEIGVARSTINEWIDQNYEFSEAVKRAKAKCAAWWEALGRKNAQQGGGNATLVIFGLKNMAGEDWRERASMELSGPAGGAIPIEDQTATPRALAREIAFALAAGMKAKDPGEQ